MFTQTLSGTCVMGWHHVCLAPVCRRRLKQTRGKDPQFYCICNKLGGGHVMQLKLKMFLYFLLFDAYMQHVDQIGNPWHTGSIATLILHL